MPGHDDPAAEKLVRRIALRQRSTFVGGQRGRWWRSHRCPVPRRRRPNRAHRGGPVRKLVRTARSRAGGRAPYGSCGRLPFEQGALSRGTPAIAGERTVAAHDAVTGDRNGDRIGAAGLRYRAHGLRRADLFCHLRIACSGAGRNFTQGLPDPLLEGAPTQVEWKIEAGLGRFDKANDPGDPPREIGIACGQTCAWEARLEIARQRIGIIAEQDGTDPRLARRNQNAAERAASRAKRIDVRSASGVSSGRHRLHGRNPACSASAQVGWKRTFSRSGRRAGHEGRQYTPVVRTE